MKSCLITWSGAGRLFSRQKKILALPWLRPRLPGLQSLPTVEEAVAKPCYPAKTGVLFPRQTAKSLVEAVRHFNDSQPNFDTEVIRTHAETFSEQRFKTELITFVTKKWCEFQQGNALE